MKALVLIKHKFIIIIIFIPVNDIINSTKIG